MPAIDRPLFDCRYAQWLADPVEQQAAAAAGEALLLAACYLLLAACCFSKVSLALTRNNLLLATCAVAVEGHGGSGAECAAQLRFFERLLQAAVDLLDEVVLMVEPRPDVVKGYVHCYHAWFADRIRDLCDRRTMADGRPKSSSLPFADEMRTTLSLLGWVSQYETQLAHYGVRDLRPSLTSITGDFSFKMIKFVLKMITLDLNGNFFILNGELLYQAGLYGSLRGRARVICVRC